MVIIMNADSRSPHWPTSKGGCLLLSLLLLTNCQLGGPSKKGENVAKSEEVSSLYPQPNATNLSEDIAKTNDAARLLAGLDPLEEETSKLKKWRKEDFWQNHRTGADHVWQQFAVKRGMEVRKWAGEQLADLTTQQVVFQPFGGPDFVFAHLLFPNAGTFVLCGKLPCLELPELEATEPGGMADAIFQLRNAMAETLNDSLPMPVVSAGAKNGSIEGAVPLLMALAARTGHLVESVELMPVDEGAPAPGMISTEPPTADADAAAKAATSHQHPTSACMISLRNAVGETRRIFYFQQDLADENLPESAALLQFLNRQEKVVVLLRGAGDRLGKPGSSRLQNFLAHHSAAIVQDATGLPQSWFDPSGWNVRRFGQMAANTPNPTEPAGPESEPNPATPEQPVEPAAELVSADPLPFTTGRLDEDKPAALLVARPLVTNAADLPLNTEVTPLEDPASTLPKPENVPPTTGAPVTAQTEPAAPAAAVLEPAITTVKKD